MSRFFVGQRVKLVRPVFSVNQGATGRITHLGSWNSGDKLPNDKYAVEYLDVVVMWDNALYVENVFGLVEHFQHLACRTEQLEPLTELNIPCEVDFKESLDLICKRTEEQQA